MSRNLAVRNIVIVFLLSGFWHGANWTFIGWGLANAMLFVPVFLIRKRKEPTRDAVWVHWLKVGLTFFSSLLPGRFSEVIPLEMRCYIFGNVFPNFRFRIPIDPEWRKY